VPIAMTIKMTTAYSRGRRGDSGSRSGANGAFGVTGQMPRRLAAWSRVLAYLWSMVALVATGTGVQICAD